ncbi:integrin beta-PS [Rhagoletis pomonella]|uniref:integrin beta-PS n=1 Tax=Rhagoletis pomonella TaxID=28610 RepID=UPI00177CDD2F|nr:integrin beta-PS [Rhagoletis pomonella]
MLSPHPHGLPPASLRLLAMLFATLFACSSILCVEAQLAGKIIQDPCVNKASCHECIQTQNCAWCMQPELGDSPRCFRNSILNYCKEEYTWNPQTEQRMVINRELTRGGNASAAGGYGYGYGGSYESGYSSSSSSSSSYAGAYGSAAAAAASGAASASGEIVQISPQRVSLKLRINQMHSLNMRYSQAVDYPVDLYYLMDLSKSMEDDKDKLSALGDKLSETMRNITSNFRLGFGSFVDKVLMPYVSTIPKNYHSACLNSGSEIPTAKCDGLKVGDVVNFTAQILVTSCPTDPREWNQVIQIYPVGINESLIIDLQMLCSCPCERPGAIGYEAHSSKCNNHGTLMCGICECDDMHFGHNCECSTSDVHTGKDNDLGCRPDNTTQVDCTNRGTCLCGVCECEKRQNPEEIISGKFCECDNFSCERHKNLLCSGPDHGTCECNHCVCKPGWTGSACDCRASNDTCIPPNGGEICSGHGECECGVCKCKSTDEGRYSGKYCEKCPTCAGRCHELKDCVQCQMYKTGPLKDENDCAVNCTDTFVPIGEEKIVIDEEKDEQLCIFYDEDDCKFTFKYSEVNDKIEVHAQQERECPPKVFMLGIVLGVIAAIVLVGLAILLLWKLLTTIHDRREFARFEKERMNAKWDTGENPIYKQATSTFKNPMYAGK